MMVLTWAPAPLLNGRVLSIWDIVSEKNRRLTTCAESRAVHAVHLADSDRLQE